ncbi:Superoxide dismutase [Isosphaera pallida ATCC 43644]|uniref:Superoxide dismutase n=1 Tax=Isosphaera pallida (strain ATCC 43644 / DSM 9630 / IS1B) TaxID=575540 RepID=E8QXM5_ISOPI|nr:superoxide dismutase [Isosphaera pallida]ADV63073.1 Superoxide dismutase [Isosphaera pallida ATCC 43644]
MAEYTLPALPYAYDALEPHIDARTMEIHHTKHHQAYITNLNNAIKDQPALQDLPIEKLIADLGAIPEAIRTTVRNNGGGHANHALFWQIMSPNGGGQPVGKLAAAIEGELHGFDSFKDAFSKAGLNRFGSGWAWLALDPSKKLVITSTPNQDSPIMEGMIPLLGMDVWEHAYYLKYQNRRADYIAAFFNVINWPMVDELYVKAMG